MKDIPACTKEWRFPTRAIAKSEMKKLNKRKKVKFTDTYWCEQHQGWHFTTMPKKRSRDFKRYLKNKQ